MSGFLFTPAANSEPAQFIVENLKDFAVNVGSIIPVGFESYARVLHPVYQVSQEGRVPQRWAEIARRSNRIAHKHMQWENIYKPEAFKSNVSSLELPEEGSLPVDIARSLWKILAHHTEWSHQCYFAIWEGFGCLSKTIHQAPSFEIPARKFYLFSGDISFIENTFCSSVSKENLFIVSENALSSSERKKVLEGFDPSMFPPIHQSANLWWPDDRAWCVATEIDFNSTFVAGPRQMVKELISTQDLEVYEVQTMDGLRDLINLDNGKTL